MSVNNALQSLSMGLAAWVGGALISRDAAGLVEGYERTGWVAMASTIVMVWWVGRLRLYTVDPGRGTRPGRARTPAG